MTLNALRDLRQHIDQKAEGDPAVRQKLRTDAASALTTLFESAAFDYMKENNLRAELIVLDTWPEYSEVLKANHSANLNIIYKYFVALSGLQKKDPEFVRTAGRVMTGTRGRRGLKNIAIVDTQIFEFYVQ